MYLTVVTLLIRSLDKPIVSMFRLLVSNFVIQLSNKALRLLVELMFMAATSKLITNFTKYENFL